MSQPVVPGYAVQRLLGRGSGGEVWLASELATGEAVAVKCVRPGADIAARDRLRREAAVLAGIDHPHVLRLRAVVGCGGSAEEVALVLDLATGGSLARLVARRGTLSEGEVVTVLVPLAEALAEVHARGIVHGDVTPANVLFDADGRPVLADLGVAGLVAGGDPGLDAGTPGFRDPHPAWPLGPAADVHGLAATCFLALTGDPPYGGDGDRADRVGGEGDRANRAGGDRRPAAAGHRPLLDLLEEVLGAPPAERPDAHELARRAFACCPAVPVRLEPRPLADDGPESAAPLTVVSARRRVLPSAAAPGGHGAGPRSHRRRGARRQVLPGRWRRGLAVLAGAVAVATAAVTGIAWAGSGSGSAPARGLASTGAGVRQTAAATPVGAKPSVGTAASVSAAGDSGQSWREVLGSLDAQRSAAFATGDVDRLARVYTTGSPAGRRDRRQLVGLRGAGLRAEGMRLRILRISVVRHTERHVRLRVVDVLRLHRLVDGSGAVVERRPGRTAVAWTVTLALEGGRWRVYDVTRE
jgi:eukaryotic-like serine/threonine-protein kinase